MRGQEKSKKRNILFSIIVPMYNSAEYVGECIESVVSSQPSNYELILVDDGSTDNTLGAIQEYLRLENVILVKSGNCGVSHARNLGLERASGRWVIFLDSDDALIGGSLATLEKNLETINGDLVITPIITLGGTANEGAGGYDAMATLEAGDVISGVLSPEYFAHSFKSPSLNYRCIGGKIFRRALLMRGNISFNESLSFFEDGVFNSKVIRGGAIVVQYDYCFYRYRDNKASATHDYGEKRLNELPELLSEIYEMSAFSKKAEDALPYVLFEVSRSAMRSITKTNGVIHMREGLRMTRALLDYLEKAGRVRLIDEDVVSRRHRAILRVVKSGKPRILYLVYLVR